MGETTIGIYVGDDDTLVDAFDTQFGAPPNYSRSRCIKHSMRMYIDVDEALEDIDKLFRTEAEKRQFVTEAIRDAGSGNGTDSHGANNGSVDEIFEEFGLDFTNEAERDAFLRAAIRSAVE